MHPARFCSFAYEHHQCKMVEASKNDVIIIIIIIIIIGSIPRRASQYLFTSDTFDRFALILREIS